MSLRERWGTLESAVLLGRGTGALVPGTEEVLILLPWLLVFINASNVIGSALLLECSKWTRSCTLSGLLGE